ncbi:uncharacterized protein G2W53_003474 [Senna tora]|uniref:Uncharacterized protein n=1 Tax=Senna tora TaxID=362788 RepID=A0A834X9Y6_9FABA|nr:uncharacterized protein G2W53_003474 [Senna tora]
MHGEEPSGVMKEEEVSFERYIVEIPSDDEIVEDKALVQVSRPSIYIELLRVREKRSKEEEAHNGEECKKKENLVVKEGELGENLIDVPISVVNEFPEDWFVFGLKRDGAVVSSQLNNGCGGWPKAATRGP